MPTTVQALTRALARAKRGQLTAAEVANGRNSVAIQRTRLLSEMEDAELSEVTSARLEEWAYRLEVIEKWESAYALYAPSTQTAK